MKHADTTVHLFTGIRPTGGLTIANYIGAVEPLVRLQRDGARPVVFVADLHALTDNEPSVAVQYTREVVADYIALGLDPSKAVIFAQSAIAPQIMLLTGYLARLTTAAELLRIPTLKDKLKKKQRPETANALLFLYPVIMAADILIQQAHEVPVGEDQLAHIEMARLLARRFNERYGDTFVVPKAHQVRSLRILSLKGDGKMSKSKPEGALFLSDAPDIAERKIRTAQTANVGEKSESLASHMTIVEALGTTEERKQVADILERHLNGAQVMSEFKKLLAEVVNRFLSDFQKKRSEILRDPPVIDGILSRGAEFATRNADVTLKKVSMRMFGKRQ